MRRAAAPISERISAKVEKTPEGCWLWRGTRSQGYGQLKVAGRMKQAHRVAWEELVGPLPPGIQLDHVRCTTLCINPAHLRPVTQAQNRQNLREVHRNSATGIRGVYRTAWGKFTAQATLCGQRHYLGIFVTANEAEAAVTAWRREHMPFSELDRAAVAVTHIATRQEAN